MNYLMKDSVTMLILNIRSGRSKSIHRHLFTLLLITGLLFLSACERANHAQFFGISTLISVELKAKPKVAEQFVRELQALSLQQQQQLYPWGDGELFQLNQTLMQAACANAVSDDLNTLLKQAKTLNRQSNFLFEPAIAPLVELWGFHDVHKMRQQVPDPASIQNTLSTLSSVKNLEIKESGINAHTICASQATQLDLGAIGKGWAASKAADLLKQHKINNAMIDFGGDLILKGKNLDNKPWRIGLRHPDHKSPPARFELMTLNSNNENDNDNNSGDNNSDNNILAVFTSGDYERAFQHNGQNYHHIIDPRTGYPANAVRSVTVVHPDPVTADAAATALFIAGTDWKTLAKRLSLTQVLVIFPDHSVEISQVLMAKTTWLDDTYRVSVVSLDGESLEGAD